MTFSEKAPYAVLGQGTLLFIEGIYRSDFPEVILSKMPVLITSRVLPVPHFTAGWAQAAGDPACSPGSPIKSSCPREHRHALLVLHWVGLWSSKNRVSKRVARCVYAGVCACYCAESDLLREYAISTWVCCYVPIAFFFKVLMIAFEICHMFFLCSKCVTLTKLVKYILI